MPGTEAVYSGNSGMHALAFDVHRVLTWQMLAANALFLPTIRLPGRALYLVLPFGTNGALVELGLRVRGSPGLSASGIAADQEPDLKDTRPLLSGSPDLGMACRTEYACGPYLAMGALINFLPAFPARSRWARRLAMVLALVLFAAGACRQELRLSSI